MKAAPARAGAVELVPGSLYALGGMVALDGRVSWVPRTARGYQAVSCYLLLEGAHAMLVDTGLPSQADLILAQLRALLPAGARLSLFVARAELDACGNVPAIVTAFPVEQVCSGGSRNPFDAIDEIAMLGPSLPKVTSLDSYAMDLEDAHAMQRHREGHALEIGSERRLEIIPAALRMIRCFWSYDSGTRTLFTADSFGHHTSASDLYAPAVPPEGDGTTFESFAAFTKARYWWLDRSHTRGLRAALASVFADRVIERIAPTHGAVVSGRAQVDRYLALMDRLLEDADVVRRGDPA